MKQVFVKLGVGAGVLLAMLSCNPNASQESNAAAHYEKIVSLDGSISEILCKLGQEEKIVATDVTSTYPESLMQKPKVGHNRSISVEGILVQGPDVVLGIEGAIAPDVVNQLTQAGVKMMLLKHEFSQEGVVHLAQALHDSLHLTSGIEEIKAGLEAPLKQVIAFEEKPSVLFIYARGVSTLMVAGNNTQMAKVIGLAGAENATNEFEDFKPLTPEALATANPDAILLFSTGLSSLQGSEGLLAVPGVAQTKAGQNKAFIAMDGQYLAGFGPRMGEAVLELNQKLHELHD